MPQQAPEPQGRASDGLGQDRRDFLGAHRVGLVRGTAVLGQQRAGSIRRCGLEPLVVGLARDPEHLAGMGLVPALGGVLGQSDTTVIDNVLVGHEMASCSQYLAIQRLPPMTHPNSGGCHPPPVTRKD